MAETAQMNFRMDAGRKARVDATLQELGMTPSRAMRALWQFIDEHRKEPQVVAETVEHLEGTAGRAGEARARRLEACENASGLFSRAMYGLGVSRETLERAASASLDELLEDAVEEHYRERGLL